MKIFVNYLITVIASLLFGLTYFSGAAYAATFDVNWIGKAPIPTPKDQLRSVVDSNGKVYELGGNLGNEIVGTVNQYDPSLNIWLPKQNMITARENFGVTLASNGKIYIVGGQATNGDVISSLEEYDPISDIWQARSSMPTARTFVRLVSAPNGKLYAMGGNSSSGQIYGTVEEYDPANDIWTTKTSLVFPENFVGPSVQAAVLGKNGKIYAIVGGQGIVDLPTSKYMNAQIEEYNPLTDTWTEHSATPKEMNIRNFAHFEAFSTIDGKIYILGGLTTNGINPFVYEYNISQDSWTRSDSFWAPNRRYVYGLAQLDNGDIYAIGGIGYDMMNFPNFKDLDSVEKVEILSGNNAPVVDVLNNATIITGDTFIENGSFSDPDSTSWTAYVDYGDGAGYEPLTLNPDNTFTLSHQYNTANQYNILVLVRDDKSAEGYGNATVTVSEPTPTITPTATPTSIPPTATPTPTITPTPTVTPTPRQLTSVSPAKVWVGLSSVLGAGAKFDLKAEAYKGTTLVSSGQINSFDPGLGLFGFSSAKLGAIPFNSFQPVDFPQGSTLNIKVYARTACTGSQNPLGTARLWYNDSQANSSFGATIATNTNNYYLRNNFVLATSVGSGPKQTVTVQGGAACSAFKSFGTWTITP